MTLSFVPSLSRHGPCVSELKLRSGARLHPAAAFADTTRRCSRGDSVEAAQRLACWGASALTATGLVVVASASRKKRRCQGNFRRRRSRPLAGAGSVGSTGQEDEYPWSFEGRVRFRPAIVSAPQKPIADGVQPLALFGASVGGSVCLQYDTSPVGPYLEVVQMTAAVFSERLATAALWGQRLMVSSDEADKANTGVWGVPSESRDIEFEEEGCPAVFTKDDGKKLRIGGWREMYFKGDGAETWGQLPIWWTPTIKALWFPFSFWRNDEKGGSLPLRRLRLSAAAVRLRWAPVEEGGDSFEGMDSGKADDAAFRIPLPFVIEADGVLIEIGQKFDQL
eukprot:TRINITY_DN93112_c0_g1_i1.p1 TRINITY_DN93112_c0_g1~~TRINITY_DN93112_c0_g1_i1.p1  ORF type:complete len:337 (+),score=56.66 TRINITY_DN93112_c0_g1_i1:40-1050(+)